MVGGSCDIAVVCLVLIEGPGGQAATGGNKVFMTAEPEGVDVHIDTAGGTGGVSAGCTDNKAVSEVGGPVVAVTEGPADWDGSH